MISAISAGQFLGSCVNPYRTSNVKKNREHLENSLKTVLRIDLPVFAAAGLYALNPKFGIVTKSGNLFIKAAKYIADKFPKLGIREFVKESKILKNLVKNPTKLGIVGLAVAGLVHIINTLNDFYYNKGKIDQKYENPVMIYYKNGGRGIY